MQNSALVDTRSSQHKLASRSFSTSWTSRIKTLADHSWRSFGRDCRGAIAVTAALSLTAVVGIAGLGTEVAGWYFTKRTMQGAADSAASTAAAALATGVTGTPLTTGARSIAASFSFVDGSGGTTVSVNNPPGTGSHSGDSTYVEVIIAQTQARLISSLVMSSNPTISARAVAQANLSVSAQGCVLALNKTESGIIGLGTSGTPALNLSGCAVYVNAGASNALNLNGSATISAKAAYIHGNVSGTGLTTTDGTFTGTDPIADPYASVSVPSYSGCDQSGNYHLVAGQTATISPGASGVYVFCNKVTLDGGSTLNLSPGIYIIDSNNALTIGGNSTLNGTGGVTIILTNHTGGNPATANIASNANVNITAPTTGPTKGLAFFQDRLTCSGNTNQCGNSLAGGATQNITGAIYFPKNALTYTGGSSTGGAICTQLIADTISFTGNSTFNSSCSSAGTKTVSITGGKLVQ